MSEQVQKNPHSFTVLDDVPVAVCNDCGAYAPSVEGVVHFDGCVPGESDAWAAMNNERDLEAEEQADEEYRKYIYGEL